MEHWYDYTIIALSPNRRRGERANVGIIVDRGDDITVRVIPDTFSKLAALSPEADLSSLTEIHDIIKKLYEASGSYEGLVKYASDSGYIIPTVKGKFIAENENSFNKNVQQILNELVESRKTRKRVTSSSRRVRTRLKELFINAKIFGNSPDDIEKHLVVERFPIDDEIHLEADFAIQNGSLNISQTVDFTPKTRSQIDNLRHASLVSTIIEKARENFSDETKAYVVYDARTQDEIKAAGAINLIGDKADGIFNMESNEDLMCYMDLIIKASRTDMISRSTDA